MSVYWLAMRDEDLSYFIHLLPLLGKYCTYYLLLFLLLVFINLDQWLPFALALCDLETNP